MTHHSRDLITGPITIDYFVKKISEGWTLTAVEWSREVDDRQTTPALAGSGAKHEEIPYGLQVAKDGLQLEANPMERTALLLILDKIVRDERITKIAAELNAAGLRTREGHPWTPSAVFNLLPRLIEAAPNLFKTPEWLRMKSEVPASRPQPPVN